MAAIQTLRLEGGRLAAAVAVSFLTIAGVARAQELSPLAVSADSAAESEMLPGSMPLSNPTCYSGVGGASCREMGFCETMHESLFGDCNTWRPLSLDTFFSEGWNEPWAGGPAGQSGLTPRHGWLGSFEGVFYRLWLVNGTYQSGLNQPYGGDAYRGNFSTFLPFNRRFELFVDAPFVTANGTADPTQGYQSDFGDISLAASFLLSENAACTQLFTVGAVVPTGEAATGGDLTALNPRYSFWTNPSGAWVVRGGTGVIVPLDEKNEQTKFNADLAVGRYFRPHDVPFGDLVFYVNCNVFVPIETGGGSQVGLGPGTRFQITGDWYFLNYWEFQPGDQQPYDFQMQAAIVKAF